MNARKQVIILAFVVGVPLWALAMCYVWGYFIKFCLWLVG